MFGSIGKQIRGYLVLLGERPTSKRRLKKLAKKGKIKLDTRGLDLKGIGEAGKKKHVADPKAKEKPGQEVAKRKSKWRSYHEFCLNCKEPLQGKFCHHCGQKDSDFRRPYWTFLEDFTENVISRDSRLWRTLGYILFMPGAMTREFIGGRRIRFLPPIRLFLVAIILFFLTVNLLDVAIGKLKGIPITYEERLASLNERLADDELELAETDPEDVFDYDDAVENLEKTQERIADLETWRQEQLAREDQDQVHTTGEGKLIYDYDVEFEMFSEITIEDQLVPLDVIEEDFQFGSGFDDEGDFEEGDESTIRITSTSDDEEAGISVWFEDFLNQLAPKVERGFKNWAEDPKRLNAALNNWVPIIMGIFVPLTAIFLRFYYWKKEHFLYNHLVFSLHFHTYIFFVLTFFVLATVFVGSSVSTWAFAGAVPLYFFVALKVATGQGWFRTFFKFLIIFLFYSIGFSMMMGTILIFSLAEA